MAKETKQFQTEVNQLFDIMVNSLYSQREIFLRELISNASDSLDKVRFEEHKNPSLATDQEKHIRLKVDKEQKTLAIIDNGIGMSYEDMVQSLGTIAYSGTKEFIKKAQEIKDKPELIGQFGVGFYSAFMVADKVTVHSCKAGTNQGVVWESKGDGAYEIEQDIKRPEGRGTTITLHLKDNASKMGEDAQDFTDEWTLKSIVRKYSDFIAFPIKMLTTKEESERDSEGKAIEGKTKTVTEDETLNSQKALWLKPAKDIKQEEYNEFYKHQTHDWQPPQEVIHYRAEGTQEFAALLYVPSALPFDYNQREMKYGLSLYVKRVFIADNCEELVPQYLRFMKGVIDSSDLPLNISRELLQKDRQIGGIRKAVVSKILRSFKNNLAKNRSEYETFWKLFGATLKEGIPSEPANKDELTDLCLFQTSNGEGFSTLAEYVERMKPEQKGIYYILGENLNHIQTSPYLEKLKQKGYEVIYLTDTVDEWVMNSLQNYKEKPLQSIAKEDLDLDTEKEKKEKEEDLATQQKKFKDLTTQIQKALDEHIKEVKISERLVDSPVCLVSGSNDPSAHMEKILGAMGQDLPKTKRILEINPQHPIFDKMLKMAAEKQNSWAEILYNQALLNEGSPIKDPARFNKQISQLMVDA